MTSFRINLLVNHSCAKVSKFDRGIRFIYWIGHEGLYIVFVKNSHLSASYAVFRLNFDKVIGMKKDAT